MSSETAVARIITICDRQASFWSTPGWAPEEAAKVLALAELSRLPSLARCLRLWLPTPPPAEVEGRLILGYANIGSLVEASMQLSLAVFHADFSMAAARPRGKGGHPRDLVELTLEPLRMFFETDVFFEGEKQQWAPWIKRIQNGRNAIHSFKRRKLDSHEQLLQDLKETLRLVYLLDERLPYADSTDYPDGGVAPLPFTLQED